MIYRFGVKVQTSSLDIKDKMNKPGCEPAHSFYSVGSYPSDLPQRIGSNRNSGSVRHQLSLGPAASWGSRGDEHKNVVDKMDNAEVACETHIPPINSWASVFDCQLPWYLFLQSYKKSRSNEENPKGP